jgi:CheY-like chemotaxis protein
MCWKKQTYHSLNGKIQYLFYFIVGLFQVAYVDFGNMSNPKITDILRLTIGVVCRKVQHMNSTTQLQRKRDSAVKLESTCTIAKTTFCPMIKLKLNAAESFLRVLHVDDDACFLNISKQILEMDGKIEVEMVTSVDEALDNLKQFHYDVIISDYEMPEKNGLQFLQELKKIAKSPPFILFTGKERGTVAVKAQSLGAFRYLNKNGDPEHVYAELASFIEQAADM